MIGALAMPFALVPTTNVVLVPKSLPLAPVLGVAKVTFTPGTGLLDASSTVTASAFANAVFTVVVCGVVPAFAVIVLAAPAVLVRLKLAAVRPAEVADTV